MDDKDAIKRIQVYRKSYNYAMEILEFQETTSIPLKKLQADNERFVVPQMYYYLDDKPLLDYLKKSLTLREINIKHSFDKIISQQVCVH